MDLDLHDCAELFAEPENDNARALEMAALGAELVSRRELVPHDHYAVPECIAVRRAFEACLFLGTRGPDALADELATSGALDEWWTGREHFRDWLRDVLVMATSAAASDLREHVRCSRARTAALTAVVGVEGGDVEAARAALRAALDALG